MFYTSDWKGERFPDGRPKVPDDLLKRAADCTIEDVWGYLRSKGYRNQYEGGWMMLHNDRPFAGRALTAQYMPSRPDMTVAITAEGKTEGRVSGNNSWPIAELQRRRCLYRRRLWQAGGRHPDRLQPGQWHLWQVAQRLCLQCLHPRPGGKQGDQGLQRLVSQHRSIRDPRHGNDRDQCAHPHRPRHRTAGRHRPGQGRRHADDPGHAGGRRHHPPRNSSA